MGTGRPADSEAGFWSCKDVDDELGRLNSVLDEEHEGFTPGPQRYIDKQVGQEEHASLSLPGLHSDRAWPHSISAQHGLVAPASGHKRLTNLFVGKLLKSMHVRRALTLPP